MIPIYIPLLTATLIVAAVYTLIYLPMKRRQSDQECRTALDRIRREQEEEVRNLARQLMR